MSVLGTIVEKNFRIQDPAQYDQGPALIWPTLLEAMPPSFDLLHLPKTPG